MTTVTTVTAMMTTGGHDLLEAVIMKLHGENYFPIPAWFNLTIEGSFSSIDRTYLYSLHIKNTITRREFMAKVAVYEPTVASLQSEVLLDYLASHMVKHVLKDYSPYVYGVDPRVGTPIGGLLPFPLFDGLLLSEALDIQSQILTDPSGSEINCAFCSRKVCQEDAVWGGMGIMWCHHGCHPELAENPSQIGVVTSWVPDDREYLDIGLLLREPVWKQTSVQIPTPVFQTPTVFPTTYIPEPPVPPVPPVVVDTDLPTITPTGVIVSTPAPDTIIGTFVYPDQTGE